VERRERPALGLEAIVEGPHRTRRSGGAGTGRRQRLEEAPASPARQIADPVATEPRKRDVSPQ
jgi:hypothetical protein